MKQEILRIVSHVIIKTILDGCIDAASWPQMQPTARFGSFVSAFYSIYKQGLTFLIIGILSAGGFPYDVIPQYIDL